MALSLLTQPFSRARHNSEAVNQVAEPRCEKYVFLPISDSTESELWRKSQPKKQSQRTDLPLTEHRRASIRFATSCSADRCEWWIRAFKVSTNDWHTKRPHCVLNSNGGSVTSMARSKKN